LGRLTAVFLMARSFGGGTLRAAGKISPHGQTGRAIGTQNLRNKYFQECLKPELRQNRWSVGRAQKFKKPTKIELLNAS